MKQLPEYPVTVVFHEDGEVWVLNNETEIANSLEWFDSKDVDEHATVTDNKGRAVRLLVKELEVHIFELEE